MGNILIIIGCLRLFNQSQAFAIFNISVLKSILALTCPKSVPVRISMIDVRLLSRILRRSRHHTNTCFMCLKQNQVHISEGVEDIVDRSELLPCFVRRTKRSESAIFSSGGSDSWKSGDFVDIPFYQKVCSRLQKHNNLHFCICESHLKALSELDSCQKGSTREGVNPPRFATIWIYYSNTISIYKHRGK